MSDLRVEFDKIYKRAYEEALLFETWAGHYLSHKIELEILSHQFDFRSDQLGLEIGCGNAFQSILLASLTKKIYATDLYGENSYTHSVGINKAKSLISRMGVDNITLISCLGTSLPFSDNCFDFVFSSSTLEHLRNKSLALAEMRRVLKPDGHVIIIVPTCMPCVYGYIHTFLYPIARFIKLFNKKLSPGSVLKEDVKNPKISLWRRYFLNHSSFPFPELHGEYSNTFEEFHQQRPSNWAKLIESCGLRITKSFPVCCIPWLLIEPFSTKVAATMYANSKKLHQRLSNNKIIRTFSYLIGFIAIKE